MCIVVHLAERSKRPEGLYSGSRSTQRVASYEAKRAYDDGGTWSTLIISDLVVVKYRDKAVKGLVAERHV